MKRAGHLWEQVVERGNLLCAFHKAARGKRQKLEVRRFGDAIDTSLERLREQIISGTFQLGRFHVFKVYDPKERTIHAARFEERVFQHAIMNVCEPFFERQLIYHTYACRQNKGRLRAIKAGERNARRNQWYLKLDIRKYFESIPHAPLLGGLRRLFKDPELLDWLERIVGSHCVVAGRGLPIGSLSSQYLANFYLSELDRLCQSLPGIRGYVRYMDDFVLWASEKDALLEAGRRIECFVGETLMLSLKHPPCPLQVAHGMDFLGYRIYPTHTRLSRRSKVRYVRKLRILKALSANGTMGEGEAQQRLTALTAFTLPARSWAFRSRTLSQFRSVAIGLEPCEPGRQLEQQREQLPRCESQQQQPVEQQQQHRVPPCPQLRPNTSDGAIRHHQGTEPATAPILRHAEDKQ